MTADVPAVAATSPGLRTLSERALFGWSQLCHETGIPSASPNPLPVDFKRCPLY